MTIGSGGSVTLEPIVVPYGLMKHDVRKTPTAMRVLGFINTSAIHHRSSAPNVPSNVPSNEPLPQIPDVSDAAC